MNTPVFKEFFKYISFNILGQMAYSCYTLADTFFVSANCGTDGLTALNLAFPLFCLMNGIGLMIGIGGGNGYSIAKSRGDQKQADRIFTNALYLASAFAALFFLAGLFFSGSLVKLLGADNSVYAITNTYLKVLLLFAPAFLMNNLLQCFVRNDGFPSLSMAAMMTGSFSNIVLDYIFIFPLRMGIFGAAFATGLAPLISMSVLFPFFLRKKHGFHFRRSSGNGRATGQIVASGIPPFLTEAASGVVMFLFNFIILGLSHNVGVAAFGVVTVISLVVVALYTGLSQGIQPLLSRYYGKGQKENIRRLLKYALTSAFLLSLFIYTIIFWNASLFTSVFNSERDPILQNYAVTGLKLYFTSCPFLGFSIVISTYFISTGKPVPAQIISLLRSFLILIPAAFLLAHFWKMTGIWCACPVTEGITAGIALLLLLKHRKHLSANTALDDSKDKYDNR